MVFGVEIREYRRMVHVPRRVFQRLLPERPTPERCVEAYYLQRTRLERIAERKLRRRQLIDDGNVESPAAICERVPPGGRRSRARRACARVGDSRTAPAWGPFSRRAKPPNPNRMHTRTRGPSSISRLRPAALAPFSAPKRSAISAGSRLASMAAIVAPADELPVPDWHAACVLTVRQSARRYGGDRRAAATVDRAHHSDALAKRTAPACRACQCAAYASATSADVTTFISSLQAAPASTL